MSRFVCSWLPLICSSWEHKKLWVKWKHENDTSIHSKMKLERWTCMKRNLMYHFGKVFFLLVRPLSASYVTVRVCFVCIVVASKQNARQRKEQLLHWKHSVAIGRQRSIFASAQMVQMVMLFGPNRAGNHVVSQLTLQLSKTLVISKVINSQSCHDCHCCPKKKGCEPSYRLASPVPSQRVSLVVLILWVCRFVVSPSCGMWHCGRYFSTLSGLRSYRGRNIADYDGTSKIVHFYEVCALDL